MEIALVSLVGVIALLLSIDAFEASPLSRNVAWFISLFTFLIAGLVLLDKYIGLG